MHMRSADYRRRQVLYGMRPAPAVVAAQPAACPRCGRKATDPASFCSGCGAAMTGFPVLREPTAAPPQGFQWKWALLTIPIVAAVTVACMVVAVIVAGVLGHNLEDLGRGGRQPHGRATLPHRGQGDRRHQSPARYTNLRLRPGNPGVGMAVSNERSVFQLCLLILGHRQLSIEGA